MRHAAHYPQLESFIKKRSALFWYIPQQQKGSISETLLVETVMNYGSLEDFREMAGIMGIGHVAQIFFGMDGRKRQNLHPEIYHFYSLLLQPYAQRNP